MFSFKQWAQRRLLAKAARTYKAGFGWAMTAFYVDHMDVTRIMEYAYSDSDMLDDEYNKFDNGVWFAVETIKQQHFGTLEK